MFTEETLRNIPKKNFYPLLTNHGFKNASNKISGKTRYDYERLVDFFKENLNENPSLLEEFEELIKENLYFNQMNQHYLYQLVSFLDLNIKELIPLEEVLNILNAKCFKLNGRIIEYECYQKYDLCSTTYDIENIDGTNYLSNLRFIVFAETIKKNDDDFNLFCTIDIDFKLRFISFKFNTLVFDNVEDRHKIIHNIENMLYSKHSPLSRLNIGKHSHNLSTVRKMIQNIFIDLSQQAEEIIKLSLPDNIDRKISNFMESLNIEHHEIYKNQIISVVYQDISSNFSINDFKNGWVFRFLFIEGDNIRASSRSQNNLDHIYSSQIYWNLKELMFDRKGTEFIEAGFLWNIDTPDNFDTGTVSVTIEQNNDDIRLNYYVKSHNSINRKEKEKVVLQNIRKGLSTR